MPSMRRFDDQIEFLAALTAHPSTRGNEQAAQDFMAGELAARGYAVDRWQIDVDEIRASAGLLAGDRRPTTTR